MNKEEIEKEDRELKISIPLLTQEDIDRIDINMDEMINQFTKMVVKEKDLIIAQYIIKRQQEKIEKLEQKESILDKVTDKLSKMKQSIEKLKNRDGESILMVDVCIQNIIAFYDDIEKIF